MSRLADRLQKRQQQEPTLSLAMIVKDEAATLEKCLRTARPHVDEIAVVDTGSTDGTRAIARRYADVYDEIEWPDSFSEARNHSFDLATSDYILFLDGDEYIPEVRHWRRLRRALRQPRVAAAQIRLRNLLAEDQILAADCMWQDRVFRNHPDLRFVGRVHNQISEALNRYTARTGERVVRVEAEAIHTGYALPKKEKQAKYRARLHLLKAEYESPRSAKYEAYYGYQLGVAYFILERYGEALAVIDALDYELLTPQNAFYTHLLGAKGHLNLGDPATALGHTERMFVLSRTEPVAYFLTGVALLKGGQVSDGLLMLLEAFAVNERADSAIRFVLNPLHLLEALAEVFSKIGFARPAEQFRAWHAHGTYDPARVQALIGTLQSGLVLAERAAPDAAAEAL